MVATLFHAWVLIELKLAHDVFQLPQGRDRSGLSGLTIETARHYSGAKSRICNSADSIHQEDLMQRQKSD
jgi:hypothetical protein